MTGNTHSQREGENTRRPRRNAQRLHGSGKRECRHVEHISGGNVATVNFDNAQIVCENEPMIRERTHRIQQSERKVVRDSADLEWAGAGRTAARGSPGCIRLTWSRTTLSSFDWDALLQEHTDWSERVSKSSDGQWWTRFLVPTFGEGSRLFS